MSSDAPGGSSSQGCSQAEMGHRSALEQVPPAQGPCGRHPSWLGSAPPLWAGSWCRVRGGRTSCELAVRHALLLSREDLRWSSPH